MADPSEPLQLATVYTGPRGVQGVRVRYTWRNHFTNTESGPSPVTQLDWDGTDVINAFRVSAPVGVVVMPDSGDSTTWPDFKVYVSLLLAGAWLPYEVLQSYLGAVSVDDGMGGVVPGFSLGTWFADALLPAPDWLRLVHADWGTAFETNGTFAYVYSRGVLQLQTPFNILNEPPPVLMGQDPDTGLPAFCPAPSLPAPVTPTTSPPIETPTAIPPTTPPPTDAHKRYCAQAIAMESYLVVNYDLVAQILSGVFATYVGELTYDVLFKLANVLSKVFQPPWGSFYQAPVLVTLLNGIWQYIVGDATAGTLGGPNLFKLVIHLFPQLTGPQIDLIKCACFCALESTGGEVNATFVTTWRNYMAESNPAFPLPGLQAFVCALEDYVPLVYWQALAAIGGLGSSTTCDLCDCGAF